MTQEHEDNGAGELVEITVPEGVDKARADRIVADALPEFSRTRLQEIFDAQQVFVDGVDQPINRKYKLSSGDVLRLPRPEDKTITVTPVAGVIDVLYEDADILVINKAAGVVTHPGSGTGDDTLVHYLLHHTGGKLATAGGQERPGVVHRLDKETSGAMVFAKTDAAYGVLSAAFAERTVDKEYLALAAGVPELDAGTILEPIGRHAVMRHKMQIRQDGRPAHTDWQVEQRFAKPATLFRCHIHTGRTHQVRVHLSSLGHPILGDFTYGYKKNLHNLGDMPRVLLHAHKLAFAHPTSGTALAFEAPLPEDFVKTMGRLRQ